MTRFDFIEERTQNQKFKKISNAEHRLPSTRKLRLKILKIWNPTKRYFCICCQLQYWLGKLLVHIEAKLHLVEETKKCPNAQVSSWELLLFDMKEGEDVPSEDDELSLNKKRTREEKEAEDRVRPV